eukprot:TRINITY_DN4077_c0_g1_i2.p1 TRINITY_DN4077_c0_g1~~TRINITY_DN4077_c0_g1_i2.p1  ORF type:complete len:100 (-),score=12.56 TRINITY_DN4077_c0_g1_i2:315-614(-)
MHRKKTSVHRSHFYQSEFANVESGGGVSTVPIGEGDALKSLVWPIRPRLASTSGVHVVTVARTTYFIAAIFLVKISISSLYFRMSLIFSSYFSLSWSTS